MRETVLVLGFKVDEIHDNLNGLNAIYMSGRFDHRRRGLSYFDIRDTYSDGEFLRKKPNFLLHSLFMSLLQQRFLKIRICIVVFGATMMSEILSTQ